MTGGWRWLALLVGVVLCASPAAAFGQASSAIPAQALVLEAIEVTPLRDLTFGLVMPGVPKTVPPTDANAGRWRVKGQQQAQVLLVFTLPPVLFHTVSTAPMTIGSWVATWSRQNSATAGATVFTPSATPTTAQLSNGGNAWIFIGATVSPTAIQQGGAYTNRATLVVVYP